MHLWMQTESDTTSEKPPFSAMALGLASKGLLSVNRGMDYRPQATEYRIAVANWGRALNAFSKALTLCQGDRQFRLTALCDLAYGIANLL